MSAPSSKQLARWHADFEAALPKMRIVMRFRLRHLSGERHETAMNDAVSVAWENYRSLCVRGKDPEPYINKIAEYASRNVRSRLAAQTELPSLHAKENGAMSPRAAHALADHRAVSPADSAAFKLDFQEWLDSLQPLDRKVVKQFAKGLDNTEVGEKNGFSRGWGSLMRGKLREDYQRFTGEDRER